MKKVKSKHSLFGLLIALLLPVLLFGCGDNDDGRRTGAETVAAITEAATTEATETETQTETNTVTPETESETQTESETEVTASEMKVHFLDVGQGLSILVQTDGKNLIYDGGDKGSSSFVVSYLKQQGVEEIDYLISSHYDMDHLAGLIGCLNAFDVHNVISSDYEHDTKLYQSFINTVDEKGLTMQHPDVGTEFQLGEATFTILAPTEIVSDSNANSVVIKIANGDNSFIFTGDADHKSEEAMIASDAVLLECDVLAISHHGSATASSYDFLGRLVPEYAVISVGEGNQYGHPHRDVTERLEEMEIDLFRSDKQGTVVATSNGSDITWDAEPCNDYSPGDDNDYGTQPTNDDPEEITEAPETEKVTETSAPETQEPETEPQAEAPEPEVTESMVWKSETGSKYHSYNSCGRMNPDKATQITKSQAEAQGLDACKNCW